MALSLADAKKRTITLSLALSGTRPRAVSSSAMSWRYWGRCGWGPWDRPRWPTVSLAARRPLGRGI